MHVPGGSSALGRPRSGAGIEVIHRAEPERYGRSVDGRVPPRSRARVLGLTKAGKWPDIKRLRVSARPGSAAPRGRRWMRHDACVDRKSWMVCSMRGRAPAVSPRGSNSAWSARGPFSGFETTRTTEPSTFSAVARPSSRRGSRPRSSPVGGVARVTTRSRGASGHLLLAAVDTLQSTLPRSSGAFAPHHGSHDRRAHPDCDAL